jgi:hypothetical protein
MASTPNHDSLPIGLGAIGDASPEDVSGSTKQASL